MRSLEISNVDFVKVNIEDAGAFAFKGMKHTLFKAKYIMIEIKPGNEWLINELVKMEFKLIDRKRINYFFYKRSSINC